MNLPIIRFILGSILKIQAFFFLLPIITAIIYREDTLTSYLAVALGSLIVGILATLKKPKNSVFYLKDGCVATALSWILMSFVGALPFFLSGEIPNLIDAFFETVSGLTTTGSSILSDIEALSYSHLIWRCFTNWIGGMGVLVFLLAVVPMSGGSNINLMKAESPGPSVGKLVPKIRYTARILYLIYIGMSLIMLILLLLGGLPLFESLCATFGAAGTGGFGIKNNSMAGYSSYTIWITGIFMVLFGVNFNAYYLIIFHQIKKAFKLEEIRWYFCIIFLSTGVIFFNLYRTGMDIFEGLTHAFFQVASIITTSGFATADFNLWHESSKAILVFLMFIGACAGSTGGGLKVSRLLILIKTIGKEITSYIHPKSIKKIKMDEKPIEHEVVRSANVYFITYIIIFAFSLLLLSFENKDFTTNFTAVAATFNNIGPGLEGVGPMSNFGHYNYFSKLVLSFDMLAGRLELFPLLMLFIPELWKDTVKTKRKKPSP
ncbi:MAG: TrkH family potassium uptake protein [Lachnospiraceae bacterium]|nr:TrkH family potassium uptake protein [Lachnospiraceae bacterium]